MRFAVNALIKNIGRYRCLTNEEFCDVAGLNPEFDGNVLEEISKGEFMHPERALLLTAYCSFGDDEENNYHGYQNEYYENHHLDIIYNFLCEMGYELSDEERAYKEGIHELFTKEDSED